MSDYEYNKGHLFPINLGEGTVEERAEALCRNDMGWEKQPSHDSWLAVVMDCGYREVYYNDGVFYKVENTQCEDGDIFEATNIDGAISYVTRFYNGGCSFDEALDEAISKMEANT